LYYNNLFKTNKAKTKRILHGINNLSKRKKNTTFSLKKTTATDGRIIPEGNEISNQVNDCFSTIGLCNCA